MQQIKRTDGTHQWHYIILKVLWIIRSRVRKALTDSVTLVVGCE